MKAALAACLVLTFAVIVIALPTTLKRADSVSAPTPLTPAAISIPLYSTALRLVSTDVFVAGPRCADFFCPDRQYSPSSSLTSTKQNETFNLNVRNPDGEVTGDVYTDTVSISSSSSNGSSPTIQLQDHRFGVVHHASNPTQFARFDGHLGLGFSPLDATAISNNITNSLSVVDRAFKQGQIPANVFAIYLEPRGTLSDAVGELTLGGFNPERFVGNLTYIPISNATMQGNWSVPLEGVTIKDETVTIPQTLAILDLTERRILLNNAAAVLVHQKIPRSIRMVKEWLIPCASKIDVTFNMGGQPFTLPYQALPQEASLLFGMCRSAIQETEEIPVLGFVFLREFYTVFDKGSLAGSGARIGLAPSKQ
ncbi:Vacuolar protease A [Mortierella claussenii]|nr:Vacuolar protease A [Mortierella claussenii]